MTLTSGIDWLLDRAVVPGYTRVGCLLRRGWWPEDPPADALRGKVVAITGANSGLGKAATAGAARLGAEVRMLCRSLERGEAARDEVTRRVPGAVLHVDQCDVSDLAALTDVAESLMSEVPRLHGLVHNAGVLPPERRESRDGHEVTLATHVLGPHLLTHALRSTLAEDGDGRVVFVSSGGMYTQPLRTDDLEYTGGDYSGTLAYARTKRMQVVLAEQWAAELRDEGVVVHSMHPGWADTPGVKDSIPGFHRATRPLLRSDEEGADTIVWLLAAPAAGEVSGLFWHDRLPRPTTHPLMRPRTRWAPAEARALWDFCVEATGLPV